jgi:hypothetical protein
MNAEQMRIREITDRRKHSVDLTGYELRIIRRALAQFANGPTGARVTWGEATDARELQEHLTSVEMPDRVVTL